MISARMPLADSLGLETGYVNKWNHCQGNDWGCVSLDLRFWRARQKSGMERPQRHIVRAGEKPHKGARAISWPGDDPARSDGAARGSVGPIFSCKQKIALVFASPQRFCRSICRLRQGKAHGFNLRPEYSTAGADAGCGDGAGIGLNLSPACRQVRSRHWPSMSPSGSEAGTLCSG
jgi:hypothetical protein